MSVLKSIYDATIRKQLPRKLAVMNGVVVRKPRLLDRRDEFPDCETACSAAHQRHTDPGDRVVIVGGGWGVSAVHAARQGATVQVFEGAEDQAAAVRETARLNGQRDDITVSHATIADARGVYDAGDIASVRPPDALPNAEVLELDCEGAELDILRGIEMRPRVVIVEAHPSMGVAVADVEDQLQHMGYRIVNREAETEDTEIEVLTALQR